MTYNSEFPETVSCFARCPCRNSGVNCEIRLTWGCWKAGATEKDLSQDMSLVLYTNIPQVLLEFACFLGLYINHKYLAVCGFSFLGSTALQRRPLETVMAGAFSGFTILTEWVYSNLSDSSQHKD